MVLHYILNQKEILRLFKAPLQNPVKGDWYELVYSDLKEINLQLSLGEIRGLSLESFLKKVKKAIDEAAFKWLVEENN